MKDRSYLYTVTLWDANNLPYEEQVEATSIWEVCRKLNKKPDEVRFETKTILT